jgi:hypothetical protein
MPVWHASVSIRNLRWRIVKSPGVLERHAVNALEGVGNDREWWIVRNGIGHLRVGVTPEEYAQLGQLAAVADAGESGPQRARTYPRRKVKR